jgi:hypothetical protein
MNRRNVLGLLAGAAAAVACGVMPPVRQEIARYEEATMHSDREWRVWRVVFSYDGGIPRTELWPASRSRWPAT